MTVQDALEGSMNAAALRCCDAARGRAARLRIGVRDAPGQSVVLDFGVEAAGGLESGVLLARACMADAAAVSLVPSDLPGGSVAVQVATDHCVQACLGSQYAGWQVQRGDYFAMASGPMRMVRGREPVLDQLGLSERASAVAGVLEADRLPPEEVCQAMAEECGVAPGELTLLVAPTTSLAGSIQVVARSVETAMHKLHEIGFDTGTILSGVGVAPVPPPAVKTIEAIGRTNDAILYGGRVTLWVDADPEMVASLGPKVPSAASRDFGRPFAEVFADYDYDFYKVDPHLFSPAEVTLVNLRDGRAHRFGQVYADVLRHSFGL